MGGYCSTPRPSVQWRYQRNDPGRYKPGHPPHLWILKITLTLWSRDAFQSLAFLRGAQALSFEHMMGFIPPRGAGSRPQGLFHRCSDRGFFTGPFDRRRECVCNIQTCYTYMCLQHTSMLHFHVCFHLCRRNMVWVTITWATHLQRSKEGRSVHRFQPPRAKKCITIRPPSLTTPTYMRDDIANQGTSRHH